MAKKEVPEEVTEEVTEETPEDAAEEGEEGESKCFTEGLFAEDAEECQSCPDAEACAERSTAGEEPKPEKKKKVPRGKGIKDLALKMLADPAKVGMTYQEIADVIKKEKNSATTAACISWYVNKYKNDPDVKILPRQKPAKKEKPAKEEKPEKPKPKAKPKPKPKPKPAGKDK